MSVICQILLNKKPEGFHRAGQRVTGTVKYAVDKTTEYKGVTLSLLGKGSCYWLEQVSNTFRTHHGSEEIVTIHMNLLTMVQDNGVLENGVSYQHPFEFHLPDDIPSSYKDPICTIAYRIQLKFERPDFLSTNKVFSTGIPVCGYVEPIVEGPAIFGLEKSLMKLLSAKKHVINLKAEVAKAIFKPGENAHVAIVVRNDADVVPTVRTELFCYTKYTSNGGRTRKTNIKVKDCSSDSAEVPERSVANLSQTIPTSPGLYSISSNVMLREYRLRVTVRLPMPHVNAYVELPVAVGERRGKVESVMTAEDKGASAKSVNLEENGDAGTSSSGNVKDAPPSYWEVMCEHNVSDEK